MKPTTTSAIMTTLWRRRTGLDLLALVEARERVFVRAVDVELPAEQQVEQTEHRGEREQRRRGVVEDEVDERVARRRADHDVGRVADESGRAADVGGHDLGEEERHRVDVEQAAHRDGHGADEQDRRHVVEKCREQRGQADEEHHDVPGVALREARALDGEVLEDAREPHHGDEEHHAQKHAERVEVDVAHGLVEGDDVDDEQDHRADDGDERAVHLFRHDGDHRDGEHHHGYYLDTVHGKTSLRLLLELDVDLLLQARCLLCDFPHRFFIGLPIWKTWGFLQIHDRIWILTFL